MEIKDAVTQHFAWLKLMGWDDASKPIEKLGLVASEIGEAAAELPEGHPTRIKLMSLVEMLGQAVNACRLDRGQPDEKFGDELADIILRVFGIAAFHRIDIEGRITRKMAINQARGSRGRVV